VWSEELAPLLYNPLTSREIWIVLGHMLSAATLLSNLQSPNPIRSAATESAATDHDCSCRQCQCQPQDFSVRRERVIAILNCITTAGAVALQHLQILVCPPFSAALPRSGC
jgi:hypothetical protein